MKCSDINNIKFYAKTILYAKFPHFIRVYSNLLMPFYVKERFFFFFLIHFHIPFLQNPIPPKKHRNVLLDRETLYGKNDLRIKSI